jgi:hypothetical protein
MEPPVRTAKTHCWAHLLFVIVLSTCANSVCAQGKLTVDVPRTFEITTAGEVLLPIKISPEAAIPRQAMLLIRGLPSSIGLDGGRLFESGVWGIRSANLQHLKLAVSPATSANARLTFSLTSLDGTILAEAATDLNISTTSDKTAQRQSETVQAAAIGLQSGVTRQAASTIRKEPLPKPVLSAQDMEQMNLFMKKAEESIQQGNVTVARAFYTRAAEKGWAPAAVALAGTYDPNELGKLNLVGGIQPDTSLAQKWYKRAIELGAPEAQDKLQRLGAR